MRFVAMRVLLAAVFSLAIALPAHAQLPAPALRFGSGVTDYQVTSDVEK